MAPKSEIEIHVFAISGGSGSGKTTFARRLHQALGEDHAVILAQDSYYIDQSHRFDGDGGSVNFDHPDALDFALLAEHLAHLREGRPVEVPQYDFATHCRLPASTRLDPPAFILLDGTLVLSRHELRPHFSEAFFIDVAEEIRFARRLKRDVRERGREPEGVRRQFFRQVKPMHDEHVQPSLEHAHHVIGDDERTVRRVIETVLRKYRG